MHLRHPPSPRSPRQLSTCSLLSPGIFEDGRRCRWIGSLSGKFNVEVEIGDEKYHTSVNRSPNLRNSHFPTPSVVYFVSFVDFDQQVMWLWYCGFTWLAPRWIHHTQAPLKHLVVLDHWTNCLACHAGTTSSIQNRWSWPGSLVNDQGQLSV